MAGAAMASSWRHHAAVAHAGGGHPVQYDCRHRADPSLSRVHLARAIEAEIALADRPAAMAPPASMNPPVFEFDATCFWWMRWAALFLAEAPAAIVDVTSSRHSLAGLRWACSAAHGRLRVQHVKGRNVLIFLYRAAGMTKQYNG